MAELAKRERYRQRRRTPRQVSTLGNDKISVEVSEAYDLVPELGQGYRWYDWPYRALRWLGTGWRPRLLPRPLFDRIWRGINWLIPFNEHDRDKAWSRASVHNNLFVPPDEHVNVAGIWVVELFPPTRLAALETALERNGWNVQSIFIPHEGNNQQKLTRARATQGVQWWHLAEVVSTEASRGSPLGGYRRDLPPVFRSVSLRAIQVGPSLTAVLAEFELTDAAANSVDQIWHEDHEPLLIRDTPRWRSINRLEAGQRRVQLSRQALHTTARRWLGTNLPGYFTAKERALPLLDLLLLDQLDPTLSPRASQSMETRAKRVNAYQALGVSLDAFRHVSSKDLPRLLLSERAHWSSDVLRRDPTWTLWGKRDAVATAVGRDNLRAYGSDPDRAIASRLVHDMYNLFVMLSVSEYLAVAEEEYSEIRDRASTRHGEFRPAALRDLRRSFLHLSIDLFSVRSDIEAFWDRTWRWEGDAVFVSMEAPEYVARDRRNGRAPSTTFVVNDQVKKQQVDEFDRLQVADREYRDILSTVASLGASADGFRLGRLALGVSIVSLIVAVATVLLADLSSNSVLGHLAKLITNWFG